MRWSSLSEPRVNSGLPAITLQFWRHHPVVHFCLLIVVCMRSEPLLLVRVMLVVQLFGIFREYGFKGETWLSFDPVDHGYVDFVMAMLPFSGSVA